MNSSRVTCGTILMALSGSAMLIVLALGVSHGTLAGLKTDMDSLLILLMIYGSYPSFILLQLWTGYKNRVECGLVIAGWLLIVCCAVYSWALVVLAGPGAVPALVMVWYGLLQTVVVAGLFVLLALIRLWHYRRLATTE